MPVSQQGRVVEAMISLKRNLHGAKIGRGFSSRSKGGSSNEHFKGKKKQHLMKKEVA